jgi:hypothetical protein
VLTSDKLERYLGIPTTVGPLPNAQALGLKNGCAWSIPPRERNSTRIIEVGDVSDLKRAPGQFGTCIPTPSLLCSFAWDNGPFHDSGFSAFVSGTTVVVVTAEERDENTSLIPSGLSDAAIEVAQALQ